MSATIKSVPTSYDRDREFDIIMDITKLKKIMTKNIK